MPENATTGTPCACHCSVALYVWEGDGILEDYTSGMVCALACCEREAWRLMEAKDRTAAFSLNDWPEDRKIDPERETRKKPRRIEQPEAFTCWGGG